MCSTCSSVSCCRPRPVFPTLYLVRRGSAAILMAWATSSALRDSPRYANTLPSADVVLAQASW
jgi:hypothetical protein